MPSNLQTLISNIPVAEDGHVIDRRYHNSLREALVAMAASQVASLPAVEKGLALTFAPSFLAAEPQPPWAFALGFATKAAGGTCEGWIPVTLPNGARLQKLVIVGGRAEAPVAPNTFTFVVQLLRQPLNDAATTTLISIPGLNSPANEKEPFVAEGIFQVPGVTTPAAIAEFQTVDNSQFKYLVRARLVSATANMTVRIYGIRVELGGDLGSPQQLMPVTILLAQGGSVVQS